MPLTVAVTGPTGEIGLPLMAELEGDAAVGAVRGMARRPFDPARRAGRRSPTAAGTSSTAARWPRFFDGADVAVHLAFAIFGDREETRRINLEGSRNVFEAAIDAGVKRLVYASSVAAYGFHPENPQPLTEDVPAARQRGFYYSAQKAELEATLDGLAGRERGGRLRLPALRRRRAAGDDADRAGRRRHPARRPAAGAAAGSRPAAAGAAAAAGHRRADPARPPRRRRPGTGRGDRRQGRARRLQPRRRGPRSAAATSPAPSAGARCRSPGRRSASASAWPSGSPSSRPSSSGRPRCATPVLMDAAKARRELGWEPRFDAAETLIQTAVSAREAGLLD